MKLKVASIILFAFLVTEIYAQVTINSHIDPESFSIVQVESDTSGVRLPRMTAADMATLASTLITDTKAVGLAVYNETNKVIEFWDGTNWIDLVGIEAANGITATSSVVELGGNLTETATNINQQSFDLNFTHTAASAGEFNINSGALKVDDQEVSILPASNFTVNGTAMNVSGTNVTMNTNGANVSVNSNAFQMADRTVVTGTLSYPNVPYEEGDLLVSDASGNARWDGVRPFGSLKRGVLNDNITFGGLGGSTQTNITTTPLVLEPGKWIIFAKCTTTSNYSTSNSNRGMFHWMRLDSGGGTTSTSPVASSGINPEIVGSNTNPIYSCPTLVHFVDIKVQTTYRIFMSTSNALSDKTTSTNGGSYFYAVRIDVASP